MIGHHGFALLAETIAERSVFGEVTWDPANLPEGWLPAYSPKDHKDAIAENKSRDTHRDAYAAAKRIQDVPAAHRWSCKDIAESMREDSRRYRTAADCRLGRLPDIEAQERRAYQRQYPRFHPHIRNRAHA